MRYGFRSPIYRKPTGFELILDARNYLQPQAVTGAGLEYVGVGR